MNKVIKKKKRYFVDLDKKFVASDRSMGFTLIELLITIAILAAVTAVCGVSLFNYYSRQNLELTTEEIIALIRDAQNRSITQQDGNADDQGDQWGIHFENSTTTSDFVHLFIGSDYASGTSTDTYSLRVGTQFSEPASGNSKNIVFSKITGLPNASTTITISLVSNSSIFSTITINANGTIQY